MDWLFMLAGFILVLMGLDEEAEPLMRGFCVAAGLLTMWLICEKRHRGDDV